MFKKFIEKVNKMEFLSILMIMLVVRALFDFNYAQAICLLSVSVSYCYMHWLKSQEKNDINDDVKRQLEEMKSGMSGLLMKQASKPQSMQQEIKRFF